MNALQRERYDAWRTAHPWEREKVWDDDRIYCETCYEQLTGEWSDDWQYCPYCGAKIERITA